MFPIPVPFRPGVSKSSRYEVSRNDNKGGLSPSIATVEGGVFIQETRWYKSECGCLATREWSALRTAAYVGDGIHAY